MTSTNETASTNETDWTSEEGEPLRIGVLLSGNGTNLQAIMDAIRDDGLPVDIRIVISSKPDTKGYKRALDADILAMALDKALYEDPEVADSIIITALSNAHVDYVIMAGYMRKVTPLLLEAYKDRVINLHPALLPAFPGAHAIKDAYDAGVKVTGVTIHFANEEYDAGPIIAQEPVRIEEGETLDELEEKIHEVEHVMYPEVLRKLAAGLISIGNDGKVHVECPKE
ncbi:MAG: phosphoribosylglycinamide formyltransferase [Eggerthellaceae bacterium]|nr:phosphoribosylglycinamide formyltransferase [Eggerthellaceae bacterium]